MVSEYVPLFLKYRSKTFSDLVGQAVLVKILTSAVIKNRLGGALLFTGIRGTGKTSTARILARALNCTNRPITDAEPCGTCKLCEDILAERHMDVIEIDAASHTGVDDVREIIESCKYKPIECKYKIYIIDEVHMLSKSAFNALLKTLEEPPSHVKFLFATTETHRVPDTILSRCLIFDLKPVSTHLLTQHLANILNLEGLPADIEALNIIAKAAGSSVRDALSILEQAINFCGSSKITTLAVRNLLGHGDYTIAYDIIKYCLFGDAKNSVDKFREYSKTGGLPIELINKMLELIHWLTCKKTEIPPFEESFVQDEFKRDLQDNVLPKLSLAGLSRMWQACTRAAEEIRLSSQPEATTEMVLVRLCYLAKMPELADIAQDINQPRQDIISTSFSEKESMSMDQICDLESLLNLLEKNREVILLNELKLSVATAEFSNPNIKLTCKQGLSDDFNKRLEKALLKSTGKHWNIILAESSLPLLSVSDKESMKQSEEIDFIKNSKIIKTAKDLFPEAQVQITKED